MMLRMQRSTLLTLSVFLAGMAFGALSEHARAVFLGSAIFPDVREGTYYDEAVGVMYDIGIIGGYENGKFGPNDTVTRGQLAVMFDRLLTHLDAKGSTRTSSSTSQTSRRNTNEEETESSNSVNGILRFTVEEFSISEGAPKATLSVVRTQGKSGAVTVQYATVDGTAVEGEDYTAMSGTLSFADGESTKTISVTLKDDNDGEDSETFSIEISNPTGGAVLGDPTTATVTIIDNDDSSQSTTNEDTSLPEAGEEGALGFSAVAYGVSENAAGITVTVERTQGTKGEVSVKYATSHGTANANHYSTADGTLTFADGETLKTFSITIIDNGDINGNKTVNLTLSDATGGAVLGYKTAMVTIYDDEVIATSTGSLKFSDAGYDAVEGEDVAVHILRVGGSNGEVAVDYATANSTAKSGQDYSSKSGTMTFRAGEVEKIFIVPILEDSNNENPEVVQLDLSNPTGGATLTNPKEAQITIYD